MEELSKLKGAGTTCRISKDEIAAVIDSHGAKIISPEHTGSNILYYDPYDISHSGIPLCFPNFDPLEKGKLTVNGTHFNMGQHGFIRDRDFEIRHKSASSVTYTLKSDLASLTVFPFEFEFTVKYVIIKSRIIYLCCRMSGRNILIINIFQEV